MKPGQGQGDDAQSGGSDVGAVMAELMVHHQAAHRTDDEAKTGCRGGQAGGAALLLLTLSLTLFWCFDRGGCANAAL